MSVPLWEFQKANRRIRDVRKNRQGKRSGKDNIGRRQAHSAADVFSVLLNPFCGASPRFCAASF
jgi:hypothetical protein